MKLGAPVISVYLGLAMLIIGPGTLLQAQALHTPRIGSPERQAICDAMRAYVQKEYTKEKLPKPVVFKISHLRVQGDFAFMECLPMFKDGTDAVPKHLPDMAYAHCLKREAKGWKIILDLSRGDVPSPEEVRQIKSSLPQDFPYSVLTAFWRDHLQTVR